MAIYLEDPFKGINQNLIQLLMHKQQQEVQREELKLRQQTMKQQMEEHQASLQQQQMQNAQIQGPQMAAQQMMQGDVAGQIAPLINAMMSGGAMQPQQPVSLSPAQQQFTQMQQNPQVSPDAQLAAAPGMLQARQKEQKDAATERYMAQLKQHLTPQEFGQFDAALRLIEQGVPKELVDFAIPESAKEKADRLQVLEETRGMKTGAESDEYAFGILRDRYGIQLGGPKGAQDMLVRMTLADRAAAQAKALAEANRTSELPKIETQMRNNFEASPVVKQAQAVAFSYGRIVKHARDKNGPGDQALAFAFINLQDQTAARDSERKDLANAGSVEQRISARFGRWKQGTVFSDEVRQQIVTEANKMVESQKAALGSYAQWYTRIAEEAGVDPTKVTYDPYQQTMIEVQKETENRNRQRVRNIIGGGGQ